MKGFMFSVIFIIMFSALLVSVPTGLLGLGSTPDELNAINPSLVSDFSSSVSFDPTDFSVGTYSNYYEYELGTGVYWVCKNYFGTDRFISVSREIRYAGFWFGGEERTDCKLNATTTRVGGVFFSEIEEDATDGFVRYDLFFQSDGNSAGGLVIYWNSSAYSDPEDAWDANELYILHGQGLTSSGAINIGSVLLSLLTLQLPNVPVLVGFIIASPLYACVVFLIWFIIKETLPFV